MASNNDETLSPIDDDKIAKEADEETEPKSDENKAADALMTDDDESTTEAICNVFDVSAW